MCGVMTEPNPSNTCIQCLKGQVDITEGITKQGTLHHCRECNRYQRPPWIAAELESAELLSLCLKNIRGLKRVKLLDASFVWTEPHSRRLKVKLTVQKHVQANTLLQQTFVAEFVVSNLQCEDCKQEWTPHTWTA
jgi:nonsense-mediated mRNA decay protein 3